MLFLLGTQHDVLLSEAALPDPVPAVARADLGVPPPPPAIFQVAPVNESQVQLRLSSNYSIHSFSTFRAPSCWMMTAMTPSTTSIVILSTPIMLRLVRSKWSVSVSESSPVTLENYTLDNVVSQPQRKVVSSKSFTFYFNLSFVNFHFWI